MRFWNHWLSGGNDEGHSRRAPLPQIGEIVRLHVAEETHLGVYQARVRALGPRRIILESAEADSLVGSSESDQLPTTALPARTPLTLSFVQADVLYHCETRVVGPAKGGTLVVARPRLVTRLQRRQFYRLPLQSPTTFRVHGETGDTVPLLARLVNLSGGGALLAASKPVPGGLRVSVRVPTGKDGALMDVEGTALDCRVASQGLSRVYLVRLHFLGPPHLTEEEREEIIAYIFEQQRLLLRNRKLLRA